jgi:alginate O-acetyltransferase complex protein AlgJ
MDALALPSVPPPAPATHRWRDRAIAIAFVAALVLPGLGLVKNASRTTLKFDHRLAAPWPVPSFSRAFTRQFESAFGDRFGGRDALLAAHHAALADFFGVSPAPNVMLGRHNWLYFLGEDGKSLDRHYLGRLSISDAEIEALATELKRRAQFLASQGIPYIVTIVPEKYTIYPEHLPDWAGPRMARTPLDRLVDVIQATGDVEFVDLRAALRSEKAREPLYYTSDSHWNWVGATIGYDAIMRAVQRALPPGRLPVIAAPTRPPYVAGVDIYRGDLARMAGFRPRFDEPDYAPFAKVLGDPSLRCARRVDGKSNADIEVYRCARPELPSAVIYRDSMGIPLIPLLSENFSRVVYVESRHLDPALILSERPDVVIEEMVERAMFGAVALPMPETK